MEAVNRLTVYLVIDGVERIPLREIEIRTGAIYRVELPLIDLSARQLAEVRIETNKEECP